MSRLGVVLTAVEKGEVANAVLRLMLFQGKPASERSIVQIADEVAAWGYPLKNIVEGLQSLHSVPLKEVKLNYIRKAIEDTVKREVRFDYDEGKKGCCASRIEALKAQHGTAWWRHFNDR